MLEEQCRGVFEQACQEVIDKHTQLVRLKGGWPKPKNEFENFFKWDDKYYIWDGPLVMRVSRSRREDVIRNAFLFAQRKEVWRGNGVLPSAESLMWLAAMGITKNVPTVDAAPVKHGRWIENEGFDGDSYYTCSSCGCDWTTIDWTPVQNNMRYCPECGAKMDLEE